MNVNSICKTMSILLLMSAITVSVPARSMGASSLGGDSSFKVKQIVAGYEGSCYALLDNGTVFAWGFDNSGQLADGKYGGSNWRPAPERVDALQGVASISGGMYHSLALKSDGTVLAWGWNHYGELGNGSFQKPGQAAPQSNYVPTEVKPLSGMVAVSAGMIHNLALNKDGTLWGWGYNYTGQLGDGTLFLDKATGKMTDNNRLLPVQVQGITNVVSISAGKEHSLAVDKDGTVYAWGYNNNGQIGDGTYNVASPDGKLIVEINDRSAPVKVPVPGSKTAIAGGSHSLALSKDGNVWAWGNNSKGQAGLPAAGTKGGNILSPVPIPQLDHVAMIGAGFLFSAALKEDGTVWAWGDNSRGQLGTPNIPFSSTPIQVKGLADIVSISVGAWYGLALDKNGKIWGWGDNSHAQLGKGTEPIPNPVLIELSKEPVPAALPAALPASPSITAPTASPSIPAIPASPSIAAPTASKVLVNSKDVSFEAYNIDGNNFFKLRDLAAALKGTEKGFQVSWDSANNAISLASRKDYAPDGTELAVSDKPSAKEAKLTSSKIVLDGNEVRLTVYNIEGNNYFKLRDVAKAFDIGVTWDEASNNLRIETKASYQP